MDITGFGSMFFSQAISWVPLVVVWAYGLSKARGLTGKYAGIGRKATIAFGGFIASIVINNLVFAYVVSSQDTTGVSSIMGFMNVASAIVNVILWILVIGAIFDGRDKGAKMPEGDLFAS